MRSPRPFFNALLILALSLTAGRPALAQTIGSVADTFSNGGNFGSFLELLGSFAYLAGAFFGVKAAIQLKEHNDAPHQVKLSKPLTSVAVSGILLALPYFISMMQESLGIGGFGASYFTGGGACMPSQGNTLSRQDLGGMFVAFSCSVPSLMRLISIGSVVGGAFLILKAIYMLPHMEQGRETPSKVIWTLISGIILWTFLPMVTVTLSTLGGNTSEINSILTDKYNRAQGGGTSPATTVAAVLSFVQLLGLIAFSRGALILKAIGENKDGALGRAMTFIFGGAAAMNISWTVGILANTIGAHQAICGVALAGLC